jgi:hypothetical protein
LVKTILRISETDADSSGLAALLATFDDSTNSVRGAFVLRKVGTPGTFAVYNVTGALEDAGAYDNLPVSPIASGGTFTNEDSITVEFYRSGDKGEAGAAGPGSNDNKESVRVTTPTDVVISTALNSGDAVDGVTLTNGDRVLVANQSTKAQNGIYVVSASPARATDADTAGELSGGTTTNVEQGTKYGGREMRITTPGSITPGTTAHDWAPTAPKDFGPVTALPSSASVLVGDICSFWADKTNGVVWNLVYTNENGQMPWNVIGGPPLYSEVAASQQTNSTAYTDLPTVGPALTLPLQGDYDIEIGALMAGGSGAPFTSYAIGATPAVDADSITGGGQPFRAKRKTTLAAGEQVVAKYRVNTAFAAGIFSNRWMRITPIRVG